MDEDRGARTPAGVAVETIVLLNDMFESRFSTRRGGDFVISAFRGFLGDPGFSVEAAFKLIDEAQVLLGSDGKRNASIAFWIATVRCAAAARAGDDVTGWLNVVEAARLEGGLRATAAIAAVAPAARGAAARHADHYKMRRQVIDSYRSGNYKTKDAAAEALSGSEVNATFRTVRDWLKGVEKAD